MLALLALLLLIDSGGDGHGHGSRHGLKTEEILQVLAENILAVEQGRLSQEKIGLRQVLRSKGTQNSLNGSQAGVYLSRSC